MKAGTPLESSILRAGLSLLAARGVMAWRNNSRMMELPGKGGRPGLYRAGLGRGSSDIVGILPGGRFVAAEAKRPGERPRAEQYDWLDSVRMQGGLAFWFDAVDTIDVIVTRAMRPGVPPVSIEIDRETGEQFFVEVPR